MLGVTEIEALLQRVADACALQRVDAECEEVNVACQQASLRRPDRLRDGVKCGLAAETRDVKQCCYSTGAPVNGTTARKSSSITFQKKFIVTYAYVPASLQV